MGAIDLIPDFDPGITEYTAETTNGTNTITATATDPRAVILIEVNGQEIENETAPAWNEGVNEVEITVTNGVWKTVYTVTVTKD